MVKVYLTNRSEKDVKGLSQDYQDKVKNALRVLSEEPLKGEGLMGKYKGLRRYRVGDFRIIYEFNAKTKILTIIKIKHRREVYR